MSLILEALRKSEAERRRGQAPDLLTELPPAVRPRDAGLSPAMWMGLAAVVLAAAAWLMVELRTTPARGATVSARSNDPDTSARSASSATATRSAEADAGAHADATSVAPTPAVSPDTSARVIAPSTPALKPATPGGAGLAQQRTAPASPETPARDPPVPEPREMATLPATPPVPAPSPTTATATGGPLELTNLSIDQRKQLPPLRMSMHMWDADPARRFVIIDGIRRSEGDRIGEAVVERISADSVLLNWNGLRLRMALR